MRSKVDLPHSSLDGPVRGEKGVQAALDAVEAGAPDALPLQAPLYEVCNLRRRSGGRLHVHLGMHLPLDDLLL